LPARDIVLPKSVDRDGHASVCTRNERPAAARLRTYERASGGTEHVPGGLLTAAEFLVIGCPRSNPGARRERGTQILG
jgi:hypothetical protein